MGWWWGVHSHYVVKPNLVLRLGWGFDKYVSLQHLSTSAISHLLLTQFLPNFKGRFLRPYLTDANCQGDISPGYICPYWTGPVNKEFWPEHFQLIRNYWPQRLRSIRIYWPEQFQSIRNYWPEQFWSITSYWSEGFRSKTSSTMNLIIFTEF